MGAILAKETKKDMEVPMPTKTPRYFDKTSVIQRVETNTAVLTHFVTAFSRSIKIERRRTINGKLKLNKYRNVMVEKANIKLLSRTMETKQITKNKLSFKISALVVSFFLRIMQKPKITRR